MVDDRIASYRVDEERLQKDLHALAEIGSTGDGGVHRPALSEAHLLARQWLRQRIQASGLEFRMDGAGNHSAFLACGGPQSPTLLLGSHLDSVPFGGRFDGALGVVAALEVLRVIKEAGMRLPVHLEAIDFTDEEGTLVGLLGSSALAGKLTAQDLRAPRGGRQALLAGLQRAGLSEEGLLAAHRQEKPAGYLELHIEQGPRLAQAGVKIGMVSTIVGIGSYQITFHGRADHAGTTPMQDRQDAAQGACGFTLALRQLLVSTFPDCVGNVGSMQFLPGAFNIVPEKATLSLEYRAPEALTFKRLELSCLELARLQAERDGLGVEFSFLGAHTPQPMSPLIQEVIFEAAQTLGLSARVHPLGGLPEWSERVAAERTAAGLPAGDERDRRRKLGLFHLSLLIRAAGGHPPAARF
jgi:N-carbamoyl-L-amino-acid hydrolase